MKKIVFNLIVAFIFVNLINYNATAQCKQQIVYSCATNNQKAIYLRDFNTKLKKEKKGTESSTRWAVTLNKGTKYRFNLCTPDDGLQDKIIMTLYDAQHPEDKEPYGSTDNQKDNSFDFICGKAGLYYVSIRFKEGMANKKSCAVGILSFVGKGK
jgi:hypothetical protein